MAQRVEVATFDAVGGPSVLEKASDGYWAGPTDAGIYRMARCGKHSSPSYPDWSKIRWGSKIKEEVGEVKVMHEGKWQPLKKVSPRVTKKILMEENLRLYGKNELPKSWLFNDFGHITCYFFKDRNGNRRLDKDIGEKIHKEYFHTTPGDEADMAAGRPVTLSESHGCIHLKPNDIDEMIKKGYFDAGNMVVVHAYDDEIPWLWRFPWLWRLDATAPFELHFFPGAKKVIVTGRRPSPQRHSR